MNIWTVNGEAIRAEINARNAIRKVALLPLLDEQKNSSRRACSSDKSAGTPSRRASNPTMIGSATRCTAESGPPTDFSGRRWRHFCITQRFEAFLHANDADEIVAMMDIAPDYLLRSRDRSSKGHPTMIRPIELTIAPTERQP